MINKVSVFLQVCLYFTFLSVRVLSDEVPVVLWNIKGNSLNIKPVSALGQDDNAFDETLKELRSQKADILVFATNKASLEDFSSEEYSSNSTIKNLQNFLDDQRYVLMSSVQDPLQRIQSVHCGVKAIVVDGVIDENVIQSVAQTFDESCVVILHIGDSNVVGLKDPTPEDLRRVFKPAFEKNSNDVVGIFTATETSWGKSNGESHRFRNLLATEEADLPNFVNITGCLIMYAEKATLKGKTGNVTVDLPFSTIDTTGSKCGNNNSDTVLQLTFKPASEFSSVIVKFNFTAKGGSWVTEASIETKEGTKQDYIETMRAGELQAPLGFSWSCGNFVLGNRNSSNAVTVTFEGFQVQPFRVQEKFSDSFDCVSWFTVPIWMGIFVTILFVAIINCGVYALFSVHTMDRFDDPKGKTITVTAATD